jgi:MFS family permease
MLVMVLASLEQTVTSTAMATIIGDLRGLEHYSWVASIYLLACVVAMPLYGRLADTLGRKRVLIAAIGIFLVASLLASTARSMPMLILYRGLQGLGAGGIMPTVLTVLGDIFTLEERAKIQGLFSAIWGTSSLGGPALGALLVKTMGWRSIFFVNIPPGLIAVAVLVIYYRDGHVAKAREKGGGAGQGAGHGGLGHIDLPGVISLSVATSALLVAVSMPFHAVWTLALVAASVGSALFFVAHERRAADPILPLDLVVRPDLWPSLLGSAVLGVVFLSLDTYVPLYVQGGRGGGVGAAASVVTPIMLAWATSGVFAAPLVVRWGFRRVAVLGSGLIIAGLTGLLICSIAGLPTWVLTLALLLTGLGFGPSSMAMLLSVQQAVAYGQRGTVTSSIQLTRTMGGAIGIGLHGALFAALAHPALRELAARGYTPSALLDPASASKLPEDVQRIAQHTIAHNLLFVFASMAVFAVVQLVICSRIPARRSDHRVGGSEALEAIGA